VWANRTEMEMLGFSREELYRPSHCGVSCQPAADRKHLQRLTNRETLLDWRSAAAPQGRLRRHVIINSNVLWDGDRFVHTRCFTRDITERRRARHGSRPLPEKPEHRAKNVLATVQATVISPSPTRRKVSSRPSPAASRLWRMSTRCSWSRVGRERAAHLVTQELSPYCRDGDTRARIDGTHVLLEPNAAQAIAVCLHELATRRPSTALCVARRSCPHRMVACDGQAAHPALDRGERPRGRATDAPRVRNARDGENVRSP